MVQKTPVLPRPEQAPATLEDKYILPSGRAFMTGIQAIVRLCLNQRLRDAFQGLDTAGFVSGYRGSPLGPLDRELWHAASHLERARIKFQPGVNEELAAAAVMGTQQLGVFPGARHDGVFALWYGKGPGVDRCADAFKHGHFAGSARHGGVLLLAGDDHGAYSSSLPNQSDHFFAACSIPVLHPADVQDFLDLGIHGWALSRYSGCWIALKALADTVESSAVVEVDPMRALVRMPADFAMPPEGLNVRWPDSRFAQEARLVDYRLDAVRAYVRANNLNPLTVNAPGARLGIVGVGKAYLDVLKALEDLGISAADAARIGLRVCKVSMPWPLEREGMLDFARGLQEIVVVEEKRALVETQLKDLLYALPPGERPRIVGKDMAPAEPGFDRGLLLSEKLDFSPAEVALLLADRTKAFHHTGQMRQRIEQIALRRAAGRRSAITLSRIPYYCSGCPHNTSTKVPEGSVALAGVGCHWMANWITPETTRTSIPMGAEGVLWTGMAPFSNLPHMFANLGDGTYFHSGIMAIRQAVSSGVNITYKLLYNDAVAMTGGQPVDGTLTVPMLIGQLRTEGVQHIVVVTDQPGKYASRRLWDDSIPVHHRDRLDQVQRELREIKGVSVLIYDQVCATEKSRRRKRGKYPEAPARIVINEEVCEGCGDCGIASNCTALVPVETTLGRKRAIDQTRCTQDTSCVKGFCPSFVSVEGGRPRRDPVRDLEREGNARFAHLPEAAPPALDRPYRLLITGIGGTGVLTASGILGVASQLDGLAAQVLDMTGMAQKNGGVTSHVHFACSPQQLTAARVAVGDADLVLALDVLEAVSPESLARLSPGRTVFVGNTARVMPGSFAKQSDLEFPLEAMRTLIESELGSARSHWVNVHALLERLLGDTGSANVFLLGYAWQKGLLPVSRVALERAIALNGAAVEKNLRAFLWGRRAAHDQRAVEQLLTPPQPVRLVPRMTALERLVADRAARLTLYQDAAYAARYRALVERVRAAEQSATPGRTGLASAAARAYFKLLAYKDEYEVARLFADGDFLERVRAQFDGKLKLSFYLAPPLFSRRDPDTGLPRKRRFGAWVLHAFRLLSRMKRLRGTAFDPFGWMAERRLERRLIAEYEALIDELLPELTADKHHLAVALASLPERIKGFGHVKERNLEAAEQDKARLLDQFRSGHPKLASAA